MTNAVLDTIHRRRSIRTYRPDPVDQPILSAVLEAGRAAPSGGNNQSNHYIVIENKQVLADLIALVERTFAALEATEGMYKSLAHSIERAQKGGYDFTFGAPVVVVAANKRDYGNALPDCAVALENMMLSAVSLGLGSCWVNQLRWLGEQPDVRAFLTGLGLRDDEIVCGGLALGYAAMEPSQPLARPGNQVTWVK